MDNNLRNIEKSLRSFIKKCRGITYTKELLFAFLVTGSFAQATQKKNDDDSIEGARKQIESSIGDMKKLFKEAKQENDKLLKSSNLELIQLMEQGDHVVKSPWSSWQFGINYYYSDWKGSFRGKGDKKEKYPYEGVYRRGNWWERSTSPYGNTYKRLLETSGVASDPLSASSNLRNELNYGLVGTLPVPDKGVPFIIEPVININTPGLPNLNINPTIIQPNVRFTIPEVKTVSFEEIKVNKLEPNVFEPPALDEVSTGFAQGQEIGLNTNQNYIVTNSTVNLLDNEVNIKVRDTGYEGSGKFSWD